MLDVRVGRFVFAGYIESQYGAPHADIACDHANGSPHTYKFPNLSEADLYDLQYVVTSLLRAIEARKANDAMRRKQ